jgi:hypothetical protein
MESKQALLQQSTYKGNYSNEISAIDTVSPIGLTGTETSKFYQPTDAEPKPTRYFRFVPAYVSHVRERHAAPDRRSPRATV